MSKAGRSIFAVKGLKKIPVIILIVIIFLITGYKIWQQHKYVTFNDGKAENAVKLTDKKKKLMLN